MNIDVGRVDRTKGSAPVAMRPSLAGTRHMASSGHYLATHAAFDVLQAGGNAVDAGVAAGIALGVVQSDFVNFAGVAPILLYQADTGKAWSISGLGWWPRKASLEYFVRECNGSIPVGILRTVVPSAPAAWIMALDRFGTMSFADVASAAIRLADEGFAMYPLMQEMIASNEAGYRRWASSTEVYLPGGKVPALGAVFRQRELAASLRYMADAEKGRAHLGRSAGLQAARDAFYKGEIARIVSDYHRDNGGFLTMQDFDDFYVEVEEPLRTSFRGTDMLSCGFWCQGPSLLQMLNMITQAGVDKLEHNSADYIHVVAEIIKLAFADRDVYHCDPRHTSMPQLGLLSHAYARQRTALITAKAHCGMPSAGDLGAVAGEPSRGERAPPPGTDPTIDTSYIAVVDRHGNAFSATPSDASNNTPVIPGTGLCPSSRGMQSWAQPGHAAAVAPGRRPRLTPNPAMAIRRGEFVMPFGTPGGDVQVQAMLQVALNVLMFGMDPQQAVEAPRFASFSFPSSFEPHNALVDRLMVEAQIDPAIATDLAQRGHDVGSWGTHNWRAGGVCLVRHDQQSGVRWGAADPRRPSYALGW